MAMKPFMNLIVAMDENNVIGYAKRLPWDTLSTDLHWFLTHATTTKDPSKCIAVIAGRTTFEEAITFDKKYVSKWHFIVITKQESDVFYKNHSNVDRRQIDIVQSFNQAACTAKDLLETQNSMIESVYVFGGVLPYENALNAKLVQRIYLTRIFAKVSQYDARLSNFDLSDFQRIKRKIDTFRYSSLDEFQSYAHRGNQFKEAVCKL